MTNVGNAERINMDGKIKSLLDDYLLEIGNVIYHPTAAISGISLLFVLQGEIDIVIDEKLQRLGANQIAIVNHNSHFSISGESDNILIKLVINSRLFFALLSKLLSVSLPHTFSITRLLL